MTDPKLILLQILREADSKGVNIGITRLVKLLYLVEVEFYRENGSRLTDLPWIFHYYGPYAKELEVIVRQKEFVRQEVELQSGRPFERYSVADSISGYGSNVDAKTEIIIKQIVGEWGREKLEELLDYVYFETEPMQMVEHRGERLDFSTIKKESEARIIPLKASTETERKVAALRERIAPRLKMISESNTRTADDDEDYKNAMISWYEDMQQKVDSEALKRIYITISRSR